MTKIITIDGPASVGKSTLAKKISNHFKAPLLHSGRLYRAVALEMIENKIKLSDRIGILQSVKMVIKNNLKKRELYSSEIDKISSIISTKKYLRDELKNYQRQFPLKMAKGKRFAVIEGRDIGTEIFPKADYKIFMWANAKIRAQRRYDQISANGQKISFRRIYNEITDRDMKDINRKVAPLRPAVNSVLLDTSYLDIEQAFNVVNKIIEN